MTLQGPHHPAASGKAARAVILLHGYGADGNDLIGLAPYFAQALPDTAFYSPNAPEPCEMAPFGRQWFSLAAYDPDLMRRNPMTMEPAYQQMVAGTRKAAPALLSFIEDVKKREGLTSNSQIALAGFSQGTMMGLHVALRLSPPVAGVVGYSGALIGGETLAAEIASRPPVLLVHGEEDQVVPFPAMGMTETALRQQRVPVESHPRSNLQHGIDEQGIILGIDFLRRAFGLKNA